MGEHVKLVQVWHYKAGGPIAGLAFSDNGNLGVASNDGCAYVVDQNGNLLNKVCVSNDMDDASYCCRKFGFVNLDEYAYITDEKGKLIKKMYVGNNYDYAIATTEDGFVACYGRCALFDLNGNKLWDLDVGGVSNGPSHYNGYWYVPDEVWKRLLIVKDGKIVRKISYDESTNDTAVCGKYLAVSTWSHLYLYDLSDPTNPKELWKVGEFNWARQVAFSPYCKYIVVADTWNYELKVFNLKGNLVLEKDFGSSVYSVAWWRDRIAVGLGSGDIYVYKVEGYEPAASGFSVLSAPTKGASPLTKVLAPYIKLKELYQQVSNNTGYKALLLKGPFQRNVFYLTQMSSLADMLTRLNQFYQDLNKSLKEVKELMNKEPTLKVVFRIMSLIQRAKVDIALIKATLGQADQMEAEMVKSKPATSCSGDPLEVIEGILKAKSVNEIVKWRSEASKYGGLDGAVKCLISQAIDELSKNYKSFRSELLRGLARKEKTIAELEKAVKIIIFS